MIYQKQLEANTVVRLNKYQCNQQPGSNKRVVIILEVEVVSPGSIVGEKLGSPVTIGSDGVVQPPPSNQNSNVGGAVKRPIGGSGYEEQPIKTTAANLLLEKLTIIIANQESIIQNQTEIKKYQTKLSNLLDEQHAKLSVKQDMHSIKLKIITDHLELIRSSKTKKSRKLEVSLQKAKVEKAFKAWEQESKAAQDRKAVETESMI